MPRLLVATCHGLLVAISRVLSLLFLSLLLAGLRRGQALDLILTFMLIQLASRLSCCKNFSLMLVTIQDAKALWLCCLVLRNTYCTLSAGANLLSCCWHQLRGLDLVCSGLLAMLDEIVFLELKVLDSVFKLVRCQLEILHSFFEQTQSLVAACQIVVKAHDEIGFACSLLQVGL